MDSIAASGLVARLVLRRMRQACGLWRAIGFPLEKVVSAAKAVHNMALVFCLI
jgi:hypothetical protein